MTPRDLDPAVWAAAYGAAFVHLYAEEHSATDVQPGFMSRRTVALERVHAPAAVEIADAAVLALHPERLADKREILDRLARATVHPEALRPPLPLPERAPEAPIDDPRQIAEKWARERFERSFILDADWHKLRATTRDRLVDLMAAFVTEAIAAAAPEPPYEP